MKSASSAAGGKLKVEGEEERLEGEARRDSHIHMGEARRDSTEVTKERSLA